MTFNNPIVGGQTLIRDSIHSRNYVMGATGWSINADGSAEFNDVTVRGELNIVGANGSFIKGFVNGANDPEIDFQPENIPGHSSNPGQFYSLASPGATNRVFTRLTSPSIDGASPAELALYTSDGLIVSEIDLNADVIQIGGELLDINTLTDFHPCIVSTVSQLVSSGNSFNRNIAFPAGVSVNPNNYVVNAIVKNGSSIDTGLWTFRTSSETTTGFTLTGLRTVAVSGAVTLIIGYTVTFF